MLTINARLPFLSALAITTLLLLSACATKQHSATPVRVSKHNAGDFSLYADKHIHQAMRKNNITGLSAIVFDAQDILWQGDYGLSDKDKKIAVAHHTQYQIGSLTKLMTAAAIMQLHEQQRLSIEDPVSRYLPDFPAGQCYANQSIRIKDLLTHEAGLVNSYWPAFWTQSSWREVYRQVDCSMVPFRPNTTQHYSNLGFTLLGNIIEKVTGDTYENYMRKAIFAPLQMHNTDFESFDNRHTPLPKLSKSFDEKHKTVAPSYVRDTPAGGVVSSVSDVVKFAQVFLRSSPEQESILNKDSLTQMLSPQGSQQNMALDAQIGLGWFLKTAPLDAKHYVIEHSGSTIYHHSQIIMYPEQNLGIIIMANSGVRFSLGEVAGKLFNRATGIADEQWAKGPDLGLETNSTPEKTRPSMCAPTNIAGFYHSEQGLVNVSATSDGFTADINGIQLNLKKSSTDYYSPSIKLLGLIPLGKFIFGDLQIAWYCQNNNTFVAVRDNNKEFTLAYKVHTTDNSIPTTWLGDYEATQTETRTGAPRLKIWQKGDQVYAQTSQFPVQYQATTFLLNRSAENAARLLYLNADAGPQILFSDAAQPHSLNFMGYRFIKQ